MELRRNEYLCTKWTRDDFGMKITIYRDKTLPPTPEEVRAGFDDVRTTPQNDAIFAHREENNKEYMHRNWNK